MSMHGHPTYEVGAADFPTSVISSSLYGHSSGMSILFMRTVPFFIGLEPVQDVLAIIACVLSLTGIIKKGASPVMRTRVPLFT